MIVPQAESRNSTIAELLRQEIACARELVHSLDQEYAALVQRDVTLLDTIVPEKRKAVAALESLGRRRETLLAGQDPPAKTAGTPSNNGEDGNPFNGEAHLTGLWNELRSLAQQCRDKNRINGSIVEVGYRQSRQALDILHGVTASSELYDRTGRTTQAARKNPLVQA